MNEHQSRLTRRRFSTMGLVGGAGLAASFGARAMDVDTYKKLGLHERFSWTKTINGNNVFEGVARYLQPPGDNQYNPCAEANPATDAPRGKVTHVTGWDESKLYRETQRDIWIYQPAQLAESSEPPDLMLFQDGGGYVNPDGPVRAPAVLDTLIHSGELRPTVGVFVNPGTRTVARADSDPDRGQQRSVEYDTLTDRYARFAIEEVLPFVEQQIGRPLATDQERRMICGISSGGICAFTAAWFHPQSFGRVLSHCGSFVNIRGGHQFPYLVRTTERKPIKVFLTSGAMDLDIPIGSWPLANQQMASALKFSGYEHRFVFGEGGHSTRHGGAIFADSLRWLMA
jgi:enterochelin esterase-like enzyme